MCAYLSKNWSQCSQVNKLAIQEELDENLVKSEKMKTMLQAWINKEESCIQEYVYHLLADQWYTINMHSIFIVCLNEDELP